MSKYVLLVETGADMPADLAAKYNIWTVPMHVAFGDETRDDGTFPVYVRESSEREKES